MWFLGGLAVLGIGAALIAWWRTPSSERFQVLSPAPSRSEGVEYAEQYSKRERIRFALLGLGLGLPLLAAMEYWAFPALHSFADSASCHVLFGIKGPELLIYGVFVGMPLLMVLVAGVPGACYGWRMIRDRQSPPCGSKVFRLTRIRRGRVAVLHGLACQLPLLLLIALAIWMAANARELVASQNHDRAPQAECVVAPKPGSPAKSLP